MSEKMAAYGWDDEIQNDGQEFVLLEEGDYIFEVVKLEKQTFNGSAKMEASPKAHLTLKIETESGTAYVTTDLILNPLLEWKISQFFRSVGMKKHGEKLKMNWNAVTGRHGRCHVIIREYTGQDGSKRKTNDVDRYVDYDPKAHGEDSFMAIPADAPSEIPFK